MILILNLLPMARMEYRIIHFILAKVVQWPLAGFVIQKLEQIVFLLLVEMGIK